MQIIEFQSKCYFILGLIFLSALAERKSHGGINPIQFDSIKWVGLTQAALDRLYLIRTAPTKPSFVSSILNRLS